jgi:hypothetical protein
MELKVCFFRSGSPQNVYLLPQRQNFSLERCPRPKKICDHPNNEPDKIPHPSTGSPDSRLTAGQIEFATGTTGVVIAGAITARRVRALRIRFMRLSSEAVIKVRVILAPAHAGNAERSIHAEFEAASAFGKQDSC